MPFHRCHSQTVVSVEKCRTCNELAERRGKSDPPPPDFPPLPRGLRWGSKDHSKNHTSLPVNFKFSQHAVFENSQTSAGKIAPQLCGQQLCQTSLVLCLCIEMH